MSKQNNHITFVNIMMGSFKYSCLFVKGFEEAMHKLWVL